MPREGDVLTVSQRLPVTPDARLKRGLGFVGVSLVALALTAAGPLWAAEKSEGKAHKEASRDSGKSEVTKSESKTAKAKTSKSDAKDDSDDDAKPAKGKAAKLADSDTKTSKSSKSAKASDDDDAPAKAAKGKASSKLADADDDAKTAKATKGKTSKLADADDDDAKPVKAGSKAKTSKLADADDSDAKTSKTSKAQTSKAQTSKAKSKLASKDDDDSDTKATKAAKGKSSKLAAKDDDDSDTRSSRARSKTTKLADADDDAPAKASKVKADADDSDDDAKTTKVSLGDSASDRFLRTRLAQVKSQLAQADCKSVVKASKSHSKRHKAKTVRVCKVDHEDVALVEALTKANTTLELAAAHPKPLSSLNAVSGPQPYAASTAAAPVVAVSNASGPVPYLKVQAQAVNTNGVLSPADAQAYQTAFSQVDRGNYDDAEATLAQVSDRSLIGYVEYRKLMSTGYSASYDEMVAWLGQYGDQPMAMRMWNVAKRKKPAGAPDPAYPSLMGNQPGVIVPAVAADSTAVPLSAMTTLAPTPVKADFNPGAPQLDSADSDLTPKSARSAYNNGQLEQAVTLAAKIGDHWVAGLADWRLKRYDQALVEFKFVSTDPSRNAWSQSSGAYWAARCALKLNDAATADSYFKVAASFPYTFYGLLAEARLGVTPAVALAKKGLPPTFQASQRTQTIAATTTGDDFAWAQGDTQAHRMNALLQLGRRNDAGDEAKSAIQHASDDATRTRWTALAAHDNIGLNQLIVSDQLFDAALYPIPAYTLKGEGGVDRALVFAFARKESKFNATAKSYAGAYGLLQLMPGTAALVENNQSFNSKPSQLLKPTVNLRVGQKYIQRLMDSKIVGGDLLRTIAAYNSGPGPVKDAVTSLGDDADSLLVMESIPVAQTRQYVEEVAANYWIYRQLMGKQTPSLTQAASDAHIIDTTADADRTDVALADDGEQ